MGWFASFVVAAVSGIGGLLVAGVVADWAAGWYRIPSFEGAAGYFVVGLALLGGAAAFLVGLVSARIVAARPGASWLRALGLSSLVVAGLTAVVAIPARLLADIPPEIDGDTMWLHVEVRWPVSAVRPAPAAGVVRLGAVSGSMVRLTRDGPLFLDDVREEEGRFVVPGAVHLFTSRGTRLLQVLIDDTAVLEAVVPVPGHPGTEVLAWSGWLPAAATGDQASADSFTYRFKVVPTGRPLRVSRVGPFRIETVVTDVFHMSGTDRMGGRTRFHVSAGDVPMAGGHTLTALAVLGGEDALLGRTDAGACVIVRPESVSESVGGCEDPDEARPMTNTPARFAAARERHLPPGWLDRETLAEPGLYLLGSVVIDAVELTLTPVAFPPPHPRVPDVPPLGLSPDRRRLVWFTYADGEEERPALAVTDWRTGTTELVPIDRQRMRYPSPAGLDPAWVAHHFAWTRGDDGVERLRERPAFAPLPYRGQLHLGRPGAYQGYVLEPGSDALRTALIEVLVVELGAVPLPEEPGAYARRLRLGDTELHVTVGEAPPDLTVSMMSGSPDLMRRIAAALDGALATGRYDLLLKEIGGPAR